MNNNDIKLILSLNEVNQILAILSEKPFKEVFLLVNKIQGQGEEQVVKEESLKKEKK